MKKPCFDYGQIVQIAPDAPSDCRPNSKAWIVAVIEDRERFPLKHFPDGVVYSVEYEDGSSTDVHELHIRKYKLR